MKIKLIVLVVIILALGWWFWPRQSTSPLANPQSAQPVPDFPSSATQSLPVINADSNLAEELNKLTLPNPSSDYQRLDELVNSL